MCVCVLCVLSKMICCLPVILQNIDSLMIGSKVINLFLVHAHPEFLAHKLHGVQLVFVPWTVFRDSVKFEESFKHVSSLFSLPLFLSGLLWDHVWRTAIWKWEPTRLACAWIRCYTEHQPFNHTLANSETHSFKSRNTLVLKNSKVMITIREDHHVSPVPSGDRDHDHCTVVVALSPPFLPKQLEWFSNKGTGSQFEAVKVIRYRGWDPLQQI